jgi:hypothetical protein
VKPVIESLEPDFTVSYANSIFYGELTAYKSLLEQLKNLTTSLIDCVNGSRVMDQRLAMFYEMINGYHSEISEKKLNYFESIESMTKASSEFTEFVSSLKQNENSSTKLQVIEPSIFYDPKRVLKKLLFDKTHKIVKAINERNKSAANKMELDLNPPLTPRRSVERRYLLEVTILELSSLNKIDK